MITALDERAALVLIDLQKGIVKAPAAHPMEGVLAQSARLVAAFRKKGWPVVAVNVNPAGAAWTRCRADEPGMPRNSVAQTLAKVALPMASFTDIVPEIGTQPGDIFITKKGWNAFFGTALQEELQKRKITQIVLGGVSTSIGVEGTARAASELGYNIAFASDAMTDRKAEAHEHSISLIFPRIGEVGLTADILRTMGL